MSNILKGLLKESDIEETKKLTPYEKFKRSMKRAGYDMDAGAKRLQDLLDKQKKEREEFEKKEKEIKEGPAVDAYMAGKSPAIAHFADKLDNIKEDESMQYAAEVTPKISAYAGLEDRKYRGSISEGIKKILENPDYGPTDAGYQQGGWRKMNEQEVSEDLRKWFKEKWVRFGPDGKIRGACARGDDSEGKPKCLPQAKAHALGKKGRKYAAAKKRREDPNPERSGPAKNVATKKKSNEAMNPAQQAAIAINMKKHHKKPKDSLNELFELQTDYYQLANNKIVQASYRPLPNLNAMPGTVKISYVNPALMPKGSSFDSTGRIQRWDKAPDGVKQEIQKFVNQSRVAENNLKEFAPNFRDDGDGDSRDIDRLREKIYSLLMKKLANVEGDPQDIAIAAMEVADDIASESELVDFTKLSKWVEMVLNKVQGVAEGLDAEAYKEKLLATLPHMMRFFEKNVQGWKPSKEQMLAAVETGYTVMKHTGDVKQAGKAMMDELNSLHKMSQGQQGVAEGRVINTHLWHGSRNKHPVLEPRQSVDTGGAAGSNQNAIYATADPKIAIAMGLTTPGSDTGMFPNDPQMVLFSGKIRKGENVYLHKVPMNGPDGKPQFVQGGNSREFHSVPGVKGIKPIEIKAVPVNKYLNLIRKATPADLKLRKKYMKEGVAEGSDYEREPLYHATLKAFEPSITRSGLMPGGNLRMFDWSDKNYVYLSNYPDIARDFVDPGVIEPSEDHEKQILKLMKQGGVILKIDQNKLDRKLLSLDPHFQRDEDTGVETYVYSGTISPNAIIGKEYFSININESMQGVAEGTGFDQEAGIGLDGESFKFKIKDLVALANNYPVTPIDPQQFTQQLKGRNEDPTQSMARAEKADLQYPIIVVQRTNGKLWIADGTHRAHKAILNKIPKINAKIIPIKDMSPFSVKQGVAEGLEQDYLSQIPNLSWKPVSRSVWNTIQDEGLDEEQNAPNHSDWLMASLSISLKDTQSLQAFDDNAIEDFNRFDIRLKSRYPGLTDLIDYDKGTVTIVKPIKRQGVGEGFSDISGLLSASNLNKSFIITAELAEGGKKKFRVKAQNERVAMEKFKKHHSMAKIINIAEEGIEEASKYPRNPASYHLKKYPVPQDQLARPVKKEPKKPENKPEEKLDELKCWSGYTRVKGVPAGAPGSCKKKTNEEHQQCPECGGAMYEASLMNEKKDACYYKVKSRYKVWPSAYASGALVKCRKKGAKNWGNKSKSNEGQIYSTGGGAGQAQRYYTPKDNLGETKSNILSGIFKANK